MTTGRVESLVLRAWETSERSTQHPDWQARRDALLAEARALDAAPMSGAPSAFAECEWLKNAEALAIVRGIAALAHCGRRM